MTRGRGWTSATTATLATLALLVTVTGGCFKLARTSPPVERYVLGGAASAPVAPAGTSDADSGRVSVGLRRLDLAPYLATLAIVVRRADNEIVTTGFHRWAEGPSAGVQRAMSGYLARSPRIRFVDVAPWPLRSEHDYLVQLHLTRFEGVTSATARGSQGEVHLLAQWEIVRPSDGAILARGVTDHRAADWVVDDYAALVTRLDRGLVVLAEEIVACLGRVAVTRGAAGQGEGASVDCVR